ncbi:thiosulfate oxidation carrier protein SoxY (plasmid) [Sinorhizobium meliloti]|nr:thiosulfate oxidation carrier protein SoxY [Sinorhizobium meliloti]
MYSLRKTPSSKWHSSISFRGRSLPRVSTRVRLAAPQHVVALAEMSNGNLLTAKAWVAVATNGCL